MEFPESSLLGQGELCVVQRRVAQTKGALGSSSSSDPGLLLQLRHRQARSNYSNVSVMNSVGTDANNPAGDLREPFGLQGFPLIAADGAEES